MKFTFAPLTLLVALTFAPGLTGCTAKFDTNDENYVTDADETERAPAYFDLKKSDADGQFYFSLKSANHQIVLQSEGYVSKSGAENGIESVKTNGVELEQFEMRESEDEQHYFVLKAKNHEIIGVSETYSSKSNAKRGMETVNELVVKLNRWEAAETGGARFDLFVDAADEYRFNLKAGNGEIVLASEGYVSKSGALNGIESVRNNGRDLGNFEYRESSDEQHYFVLKAQNGEIIGVSETYVSLSNAERGAETVRDLIASERVGDPR